MKVGLVSLGCARTLVDSEVALGELLKEGYSYTGSIENADVAIVNTCAFTEAAKKESIETILHLAELKKQNKITSLVVMGCLSQRYGQDLGSQMQEVDAILGTSSYKDLAKILEPLKWRKKVFDVEPRPNFLLNSKSPRRRLTPNHYAYIKISEGCINACSYCAIPAMKGRHRSREIRDIVEEVCLLSREGNLSEINLIGQDIAAYGFDSHREYLLAELLDALAKAVPHVWIRLLYAHPAHVTDELIGMFSRHRNICRYLDLPIEHSHPDVLKRMNRGATRAQMESVIKKLRQVPGMALRTAVIVGFPGETESEFQDLMDSIKLWRFERLGAFTYSREEGTKAFSHPDQIPEPVKQARYDAVMKLQENLTSQWSEGLIGRSLEVLVEDPAPEYGEGFYTGRSQADAPEVDGQVILESKRPLRPGEFVTAHITDAMGHDVMGRVNG